VLAYLLAHAGQLATKDELLNAVWPGIFVGEAENACNFRLTSAYRRFPAASSRA